MMKVLLGLLFLAPFFPCGIATWSVLVANPLTLEVAIASVTCVTSLDLRELLPVVVIGKGTGACQSSADPDGIRRPVIYDGLIDDVSPQGILNELARIAGHENRQYGIVNTRREAVTFTGSRCSQWAGGMVGNTTDLVYAIQGNILTGSCVVNAIEELIQTSKPDIPELLMVTLQAARAEGGDGRCSCSQISPTGCGCPPNQFTKCGHIGFMISARLGDRDTPSCDIEGCANGDYYLNLNVPLQAASRPDPVDQLQELYDEWRISKKGKVDAIKSVVSIIKTSGTSYQFKIELRDLESNPISFSPETKIKVSHSSFDLKRSSGFYEIGKVEYLGDAYYFDVIQPKAFPESGDIKDIFEISVETSDLDRPVILLPLPEIEI